MKSRWTIGGSLYLFFFVVLAVVWLFPIVFQITTAFKSLEETYLKVQTVFPRRWTFKAFRDAFTLIPLVRYYLNSLIVAAIVTICVLITSSLAAYSFAKHRFFGRQVLFLFILATMMVPFQVVMIPLYIIMKNLRLHNSYAGLVLPGVGSAFGIFLMTQFIKTIPNDLIDAARIDGLAEFAVFMRVILPLSMAAIATLAIFTFLWNWDSFLWPLIVTDSERLRTIPVGMVFFQQTAGGYTVKYPHVMAISILAMFPTTVVFLFLQRYFVKAITLTGIKG
jgi:ABC-type glycerol-3-phosphate transport system permease component